MGDRRLTEITSKISNMEDVLDAMQYITTLSDSDVYLLLRCVGGSKYNKMNFGEGLMSFSKNYIEMKRIAAEEKEELALA